MKLHLAPWLACLLAAAAPPQHAAAPVADAAGNRMGPFPPTGSPHTADGMPDPFVRHCTADRRWCARMQEQEGGSAWVVELTPAGGAQRDFEVAGVSDEQAEYGLWPQIVIEADGGALIGVEVRHTTGFAGGGASATRLVLIRAEPNGGALRRVLDVPIAARKDIRACFGDRDTRRRRGACSDQYEFAGTLTIDPATRAGHPSFLFAVQSRTFPGHRDVNSDSTTDPPLRAADLRWAADPACTFRRRFTLDARDGSYAPDRPLPACSDYLDF